jgi:chromosome segregation ATPase
MEEKVFLKFTDEMLKMAEYEPPKLDSVKEEIKQYTQKLKNSEMPDKNKTSLLKDYIHQKLSLVFNEYKSRYRQNDEITENINKNIDYSVKELEKIEKEIEEKEKEIDYFEIEESSINKEIDNLKFHNKDIPTKYEKFTVWFFIVMALGLAVLSAYEFSYSLAKIEAISRNQDINNVQIPWYKYLLFLFGSFAILIASKSINLIYEKFNYSRKFFITIASLAVFLAVSSITMISFDKAFLTNVGDIKQEINYLNKNLQDLNNEIYLYSQQGQDVTELKKEIKEKEEKLKKLKEEIHKKNLKSIKLDMFATFILLIAEIFAGATAWMSVSEYDLKYNKNSTTTLLKTYQDKLKQIEQQKEKTLQEIEKLKNEYIKLKEEIHRLNLILSKIKTEDEIEKILENYKESIFKENLIELIAKENK